MNWLEVLKEFQGIIGAVVGVISTLITTKLLSGMGKVEFILMIPSIVYGKTDHYGHPHPNEGDDWDMFIIKGSFLLKNTSESIKSIYDIHLKLYTDEGIKKVELQNLNDGTKTQHYTYYGDLKFLNLNPKELTALDWRYSIAKSDGVVTSRLKRIDFCYAIPDGTFFKMKNIKLLK